MKIHSDPQADISKQLRQLQILQSNIETAQVCCRHLPIVQFHYQILNEWQLAPKPSCNPARDTNFHSMSRVSRSGCAWTRSVRTRSVQTRSRRIFSVQRRMAFARSFNMLPSMLHMRLINSRRGQAVGPQKSTGRGPIHSPIPLSRSREQKPKHKEPKAKTTQKTNTNKNNPHKTQKTTQPPSSDVTGSSYG